MTEDLDLRLLRHFVAVAEELHFSRAAERLFVAQQAVSRDVRKLENRAGTPPPGSGSSSSQCSRLTVWVRARPSSSRRSASMPNTCTSAST